MSVGVVDWCVRGVETRCFRVLKAVAACVLVKRG